MNRLEQLGGMMDYPLFGSAITPLRLVTVGIILIVTSFVARWFGRLCHNRLLSHIETGPRYTLVRLSQYGIWLIAFLIGLRVLNIDLTALAVVGGVLGVGIGFGLQSLVANFVAGLVLLFEQPIRVGDFVTTGNVEGRVYEISFRSTTIVTNDNISIILPNSELINSTVINWSHGDPNVRINLPVGVAYGSDVELVTRTLLEVAAETEAVLRDPAPKVRFIEFGDSSLNFELRVWTDRPIRHQQLRSRLSPSRHSDPLPAWRRGPSWCPGCCPWSSAAA